jgi:hypothetical protein
VKGGNAEAEAPASIAEIGPAILRPHQMSNPRIETKTKVLFRKSTIHYQLLKISSASTRRYMEFFSESNSNVAPTYTYVDARIRCTTDSAKGCGEASYPHEGGTQQ